MSDFRDPETERIAWTIDFGLEGEDMSESDQSAWRCGFSHAQIKFIAKMNFRLAQKEKEFKEFLQHMFDEGLDVLTIKDFEGWQFTNAEREKNELNIKRI